jgi:hypothetical protein
MDMQDYPATAVIIPESLWVSPRPVFPATPHRSAMPGYSAPTVRNATVPVPGISLTPIPAMVVALTTKMHPALIAIPSTILRLPVLLAMKTMTPIEKIEVIEQLPDVSKQLDLAIQPLYLTR